MDDPRYHQPTSASQLGEDSDELLDPRLTLAAAGVAIEHVGSNVGSEELDQDPADHPGERTQAKKGPNLTGVTGDFIKSLLSDGQDGDNPLSATLFVGFALFVAGLIVWPLVGFVVGMCLVAAGALFIAAGTVSNV